MMKQFRKMKALVACAAVGLAVLGAKPVQADLIVVAPNAYETTGGPNSTAFPLGATTSNFRYQQVYGASNFAAFGGPQDISAIAFRLTSSPATGTTVSHSFTNIQLNLSTTSRNPDGLSSSFAFNRGADNAVVFNAPFSYTLTDTGGATNPFDLIFNLTTPFAYDPSVGNLLLDLTTSGSTGNNVFLDAVLLNGDSISRVMSTDPNSTSGNPSSYGLVTQFTVKTNPVPEPGTWAMMGVGLCGVVLMGRKKKLSAKAI